MANLKDGMQRWLRDHNIKGYYSCTQVIEKGNQTVDLEPNTFHRHPTLWAVPRRA